VRRLTRMSQRRSLSERGRQFAKPNAPVEIEPVTATQACMS